MITLHKLKLFLSVYNRGSFNQAAQDLYLAQSVVSQHIHDLEITLGKALFQRSSRGVEPTEAGHVLFDYAKQMLDLLAAAERDILQIGTAESHQLTVEATPGLSVYIMPVWLRDFQTRQPNVNVSSQTALTVDVVRDVLHGRCDLGILEGDLEELDQPNLGRMRHSDVEYVVAVNQAHRWAGRASITPEELRTEPFINRQPGSRSRKWVEKLLAARGVKLRNTAELDSPGAIKYALLNQSGVGLLPRFVIEREAERGEIALLGIDGIDLRRPLMLVWDKRQPFTPIQRAFISQLAESAPQLQILL